MDKHDTNLNEDDINTAPEDLEQDTDLPTDEGGTAEQAEAGDPGEDGDTGEANADDEDGVDILFGDAALTADEEQDGSAPAWVPELRKKYRELERENAQLRANQHTAKADPEVEVGEKPTLEGCEFNDERFEAELLAWNERKRQADARQAERQQQQEQAQQAWQSTLETFGKQRQAIKAPDIDDAEAAVASRLSREQVAAIVKGAGQYNAAAVVYALGKMPERLSQLAEIKDPLDFAIAIGRFSTEIKVKPKAKTAPGAEKTVKGSAPLSGGAWKVQLQRLEAEADKTGNRTKVVQYKKQLRAQGINPDV